MRRLCLLILGLFPALLPADGLPPLPADPQRLQSAPRVLVRGFELRGVISPDRRRCLEGILQGQAGRPMGTDELLTLRERLTRRCYLEPGYPNSGVLLPDQDVRQGRIHLQVVEGGLGELQVSGNRLLDRAFYAGRIMEGLQRPLSLPQLRERLLLLERHPGIQRMDARLLPGRRPGDGQLQLAVEENEPWYLDLAVDNYRRSPSVGSEHLGLKAGHLSLSGAADRLDLAMGLTRGARDLSLSYDRPLGPRFAVTAHGEYSSSVVIETAFERLDIESDYATAGLGLRYRPIENLRDRLDLTLGLAYKISRSRLLGDNFSFAPGVEDGESRLALLSFGQTWQHSRMVGGHLDSALLLQSRFTLGVDALDATAHSVLPDGRFLSWQGHGQYRRRLDRHGRHQLALRGNVQLADSDLLPLEKFALGGVDTVRGYRENSLVRDNGWSLSLELQFSLGAARNGWKLVPFLDYGRAWNHSGPYDAGEELASAGLGVLWSRDRLGAELWLAQGLLGRDAPGDSLQDEGIHFQVRYHVL